MEQITKYIIIVASVMTVELSLTESKNENKIKNIYYPGPVFSNICDISTRASKMHCYCDSDLPQSATRADCWVFISLSENDSIWPSFSSQPDIEHLTFTVRTNDVLTFIPAKAIVRLDKLKHLTIHFATIKKIPPYAFTNSSVLRQIVLKSNKITNLERHSFSQMMMLSNISLEDNQISELKRDVFFNLPNLHVLHLSNNNLTLIHEGCFKHLNNLIELKLDFNYISVVTKEMLEGLENLSRLNLRNNKLPMIGNLAFSELWGLKELYLDNNAIEYISERAFGGLTQLRKLTLSNNKLGTFYEDILEDIDSIMLLDLRNNLLKTITYETVRAIVKNEKSTSTAVYLEGNPFKCDCRLSWIYAVRNETKDTILRQTLDRITCITDQVAERHLNDQEPNSTGTQVVSSETSYDYDDYNERETEGKVQSEAIKLSNITLESLPCPKEIMQSMEESYGHPVQNEIRLKALSNSGRIVSSLTPFLMLAHF